MPIWVAASPMPSASCISSPCARSRPQRIIEAIDRQRGGAQDGVAELAHLAQRCVAARQRLGVELGASSRRSRSTSESINSVSSSIDSVLSAMSSALSLVDYSRARRACSRCYCGSTSTLKLTPLGPASAACCTAAPMQTHGPEHARPALTTSTWRSRPRRRNRAAGPNISAPCCSRRSGIGQQALSAAGGRAGRSARPADDRDQTASKADSRSARRRSSSPARKPSLSCRGGVYDRARLRRDGLHEHLTLAATADTTGELGDERKCPLLGAKIGEPQGRVGVEHHTERDVGEVVALGDHLRPTALRRAQPRSDCSRSLTPLLRRVVRSTGIAAAAPLAPRVGVQRNTGKSPSSSVAARSCCRRSVPAP